MKKILYLSLVFLLPVLIISVFPYSDEEFENETPDYDWFETQRAYPFDEIPQAERLKSIEQVKNFSADKSSNWTLAGPTNVEGRITTIAIHPTNPQIVYAGAADGGVWKSTNFCQSWVSVFDNQNTSSIGALAIDPANPEIIYCGTGEANSLRSHYAGTGMFKSTNGGSTWTFIGLPNSYNIGNIAINPLSPQEIYAAVLGACRKKNPERGLYKSTNGGANWNLNIYLSDSVGFVDVAVNPASPNYVYASAWERLRREDYIKYGGTQSALYMSSNSGSTWSVLNNGFPANDAALGRISLDICKSNPAIMYALLANSNGNTRGLYKTTNAGTSWTNINSSVGGSSNYAWFNRICKVNPSNPDVVYCGGLDMQYSNNGGTSFSYSGESHVDEHAVAFAPSNPNYIIIGNDGGIDYSTNGGSTWIESLSLPITQFYAGDINYQNPADIMAGAQDNGTNRTASGSTGNWTSVYGGDGFYCLYDYQNPQRMYAESQSGSIGRSTDGGNSFYSGTSGLDLTYTNWSTPFIMDKTNPLTLYCGTYKVYKSVNGMQSWAAISPDLTNGHVANLGTITTLDVSKSNPNVLYAGTDDANVWVTTNGGSNWTKISSSLPNRWVTRVTIHPDSANICYVTLSGYKIDTTGAHIFKTTNYGAAWISKSGNLPDAPINDVLIDPRLYSNLYIATDLGVMSSTNDGQTWQLYGNGMPAYIPVHDLTIHTPTLKMVAWTHGRSAYSTTLPPVTGIHNITGTVLSYKLFDNYPNPFNSQTVIRYEINKNSFVKLSVYDVKGSLIKTLVSEKKDKGSYSVSWNAGNLASGIYFLNFKAGDFYDIKKMVLIK
ncbi:MAG: T9SS type A sorting domain-containing protein [Ignavibacteria bacterium]|nr:T9SS type A sorting domain-containing protein [Ignavibacteria bacterium]